jgi:hypothetical protein
MFEHFFCCFSQKKNASSESPTRFFGGNATIKVRLCTFAEYAM